MCKGYSPAIYIISKLMIYYYIIDQLMIDVFWASLSANLALQVMHVRSEIQSRK